MYNKPQKQDICFQKISNFMKRIQVEHANTERLKHSAIIYMQNLLNKNG